MATRVKKAIYFLIGFLIIVFFLYYSLRTKPVVVEAGIVVEGPLSITIDEQGETRTHDRFIISTPVAGRLLRNELHDGDDVKEGEAVAFIDPLPLSAREQLELTSRVQAAEALKKEAEQRVAQLQAANEQSRRERQRAESLAKEGLISPQQLEQSRIAEVTSQKDLEATRFKARAAASELAVTRAGLIALNPVQGSLVKLLSPVSGKVLRIVEKSEKVVDQGTILLIIGNPRQLEVIVDVLSADAVKIRQGVPVTISDWGGEENLKGRVRTVEPFAFTKVSALGIEEQRVNVVVDLADRPESLGDGYRVECQIEIWAKPRVVKVPTSALFREGEEWKVFAVESNKARIRGVRMGHKNSSAAEVLSGISAGTRVILHPSNELEDGIPVTMLD